jgi:hypothetical protein
VITEPVSRAAPSERSTQEGEMGKKPGERAVTSAVARSVAGFEATVPCGTCGAPSRRSQKRFRTCANGHTFTKKSDQ